MFIETPCLQSETFFALDRCKLDYKYSSNFNLSNFEDIPA